MMLVSKRVKQFGFEELSMGAFEEAKIKMKESPRKVEVIEEIEDFLAMRTEKKDDIIEKFKNYMVARTGRTATHIGPLAADDADIAETLAARALAAVDGPVILDVMLAKAGFTTWLEDAGFQARRTFTRMRLAGDRPPGEPHRTYLAAGPEFG